MKKHYCINAILVPAIASLLLAAALAAVPGKACAGREGQPVLSISVFGNYTIKRDLVIDAFLLKVGEPFDYETAMKGISNIESLHGIKGVRFEEIQNRNEKGVRLLIIITEKRAWSIRPLIKRSYTDRTSFGMKVTQKNFRGRNEELEVSAMTRSVTVLEASWIKPPMPFSGRFGYGFGCYFSDYEYPFPDYRELLGDDRIRTFDSNLSLIVRLGARSMLKLSGGIEYIDAWKPDREVPSLPKSPYGLFPVMRAEFRFEGLDSRLYPMRGVRIRLDRKEYGLILGSKLTSSVSEAAGIAAFGIGGIVLRLGTDLRSAASGAPFYLRGHIGGENILRGYEFGAFGGENTALIHSELAIPLNFDELSDLGNPVILTDFHIFVDSGAAWDHGYQLGQDDIHSGFGCGISLIPFPNALFKFDAAWTLDSTAVFYFDVSAGFGD